ncbi:hypothetical protein SprV_0200904100 [Sparganum proliferum]
MSIDRVGVRHPRLQQFSPPLVAGSRQHPRIGEAELMAFLWRLSTPRGRLPFSDSSNRLPRTFCDVSPTLPKTPSLPAQVSEIIASKAATFPTPKENLSAFPPDQLPEPSPDVRRPLELSNGTPPQTIVHSSNCSYRSPPPNASDDSDNFENLLASLRSNNPKSKLRASIDDSSFIVSDTSGSGDDSSEVFYHRVNNTVFKDLQNSIGLNSHEVGARKTRRRLIFRTSSSSSLSDDELNPSTRVDSNAPDCSRRTASRAVSESSLNIPTFEGEQLPPQTNEDLSRVRSTSECLTPQEGPAPSKEPPLRQFKTPKNTTRHRCKKSPSVVPNGVTSTEPLAFIDSLYPLGTEPPHAVGRRRHPSAERYVTKFKQTRVELANRLFSFYNKVVFDEKLPKDLAVEWNARLLKTAGQCVYLRRKVTSRDGIVTESNLVRIELAPKVCTSADRLRDTLLHEACHAAVWLLHGVNDGHGPLWRGFARKANSLLPNIPRVTVRHAYVIDTRFTYVCTGCGATVNRHSKSLDTEKKVCGNCHCRFQLLINTPRGRMMRPSLAAKTDKRYRSQDAVASAASHAQPRSPSAPAPDHTRPRNPFAQFVREHYKTVRQGTGVNGAGCSHKEAMDQLGTMFRTMKLTKTKTDVAT